MFDTGQIYPIDTTDVYPTRYHAMTHPAVWAVFAPTDGMYRSCREDASHSAVAQLGAGREYPGEAAVLRIPVTNAKYPHLKDGVYIEILGRLADDGGDGFVVGGHFTSPTEDRAQENMRVQAPTLSAAMRMAEDWIATLAA